MWDDLPSTRAEITLPNAASDKLIFVASLRRSPVAPVYDAVKAQHKGIIIKQMYADIKYYLYDFRNITILVLYIETIYNRQTSKCSTNTNVNQIS